jgi:GxxExxY protein
MTDQLHDEGLTESVIGAAIEVHRELGPGLLERAYRECMQHELQIRGHTVQSEVVLGIFYKGLRVDRAYRMDLVVDQRVVVEIKASARPSDDDEAQLLTYLKLSGHRTGLLFNFHRRRLVDGLLRRVL